MKELLPSKQKTNAKEQSYPNLDDSAEDITAQESDKELRRIKDNEGPGLGGIPIESVKHRFYYRARSVTISIGRLY